jgi:spore maturation protein SpmA
MDLPFLWSCWFVVLLGLLGVLSLFMGLMREMAMPFVLYSYLARTWKDRPAAVMDEAPSAGAVATFGCSSLSTAMFGCSWAAVVLAKSSPQGASRHDYF